VPSGPESAVGLLVFVSPKNLVSALCPVDGEIRAVDLSGKLAGVRLESTNATLASANSEWSRTPYRVINSAVDVVFKIHRIDSFVEAIWCPELPGAAIVPFNRWICFEVPSGQFHLSDSGG